MLCLTKGIGMMNIRYWPNFVIRERPNSAQDVFEPGRHAIARGRVEDHCEHLFQNGVRHLPSRTVLLSMLIEGHPFLLRTPS
jgi:hypothetical protein